jgi:hypothetical protein
MNDNEKQFEDFVRGIKFDDTPSPTHRDKLEQDLLAAVRKQPRQKKQPFEIWRIIMKSGITKFAAAAVILIVALYLFIGNFGSAAWAIEQTIEALKGFSAVHMTGTVMDEYGVPKHFEMWMRANKSLTFSKDAVLHVIDSGVIQWVKDGNTYTYIPQNNTVYYENAITAGVAQWPGPSLFKLLAAAEDTKTVRGKDPATGREQVTLLCSLISALGPQSYSVKFDVETKLPIELAQWGNLDRRGAPFFHARQITYYEDLPDSIFIVEYPKNANRVEKEMTIPESSIGLLSDPRCGIPADGLSKEEAARLLLKQAYQALIDDDYNQFRKLCPAASTWSDELLRYIVHGDDPQHRVVEIVKIGPICKEGYSKLGLIVAVPCVVKTKGGMIGEDKMIVQFRNIGGKFSCVLHGPYGLSREIEQ